MSTSVISIFLYFFLLNNQVTHGLNVALNGMLQNSNNPDERKI